MMIKRLLVFPFLFLPFLFSCRHEPILPEQQVSFRDHILPIIEVNCQASGCHGTVNPEEFRLLSYQDVMHEELVVPGKPKESKLYEVITLTSGEKAMPRAPYGHLSEYQVKMIYVWIAQGAKDN